MANVIKLKRGSGSDPSASDLVVGEVAIRTDSGKLFTKKDNGTIAEISGSGGGSDIFINTLSSSSGSGGGSATFNGTATRFTLSNPPAVSAQQLLVSINGVVQKPNSGTSPSEGFAIDGNDIIFAAAPATGSDFFIVTYGSLNIAVPADNSVTSAKIVDGTIVGTDLATNVDLVDNQKIRFGTGNDLSIYHNGTDSLIDDTGTGKLVLRGSTKVEIRSSGNEDMAVFTENGAVELYYNNQKQFETIGSGVRVPDSKGYYCGDGNDLRMFFNGTDGFIRAEAGKLNLDSSGGEKFLIGNPNGAVELYYDNSKKFETTSGGAKWTGDLTCDDNNKIRIGSSGDLNLFHDGSHSYIENLTGGLYIKVGNGEFLNRAGNEVLAKFIENGAVELYYDNSRKLQTINEGVEIKGDLYPEANNTRDLGSDVLGWNSIWASTRFRGNDNVKLILGNAQDLQIYHNGTHSFIDETANGNLILRTNPSGTYATLVLQAGQENSVICHKNGNVELYYDNSKKFETNSTGSIVTGQQRFTNTGVASSYIGANSSGGIFGTDTAGLLFKTGVTGGDVTSTGTTRMTITSAGRVGINVTTLYNVFEVKNTSNSIHPARFLMVGAHQYSPIITDNDGANGSGAATFLTCRMSNNIKGDIVFNGSVMVYGGQSDYRLKENVVSINDGIAKIKQLNPLRYNFIDNPSHTCEGFFAHEAQAVCPQSATGTKDEIATEDLDSAIKKGDPVYQQMDYSKLVPLLTAGLKEAIVKIETLETKVAALEAG